MASCLKCVVLGSEAIAVVAAAVLPALAQAPLPDPTRPPAAFENAPAATEAKAGNSAGLQTVILRKGRKPVAVINGETVELGGKVGEATLVKLSEREAVLQGPQGREVLHLTPKASKTAAHPGGAPRP